MATPQKMFRHVKKHFGITLIENDLWARISKNIKIDSSNIKIFTGSLAHQYASIHQQYPGIAEITDHLFFRIILDGAKNPNKDPQWIHEVKELFYAWTLDGTRDISQEQATALEVPLLRLIFSSHESTVDTIKDMIYASPKLWDVLHKAVLSDRQLFRREPSWSQLLHRHAPHLCALNKNEIENSYRKICSDYASIPPKLHDMLPVLTGVHHNPLAWHTALAVCSCHDPSIAGNWMKMSATFSSLPLDPNNHDAWKFWHLLCDSTKDDGSGQELVAFLAEAKKDMA